MRFNRALNACSKLYSPSSRLAAELDFSVGLLDEAKRWFEVSTIICRFVPDGEAMSKKVCLCVCASMHVLMIVDIRYIYYIVGEIWPLVDAPSSGFHYLSQSSCSAVSSLVDMCSSSCIIAKSSRSPYWYSLSRFSSLFCRYLVITSNKFRRCVSDL